MTPTNKKKIIAYSLVVVLFYLFIHLTVKIRADLDSESFDVRLLLYFAKLRIPSLNSMVADLTSLGSAIILNLLALTFMVYFCLTRRLGLALYLGVVRLGSAILTHLMKGIIGRARPIEISRLVEASGLSYPSGHALGSIAMYLGIIFCIYQLTRSKSVRFFFTVLLCLIIVAVGLSRVYLGVHYASDVVSGLCLGGSWVVMATAVMWKIIYDENPSANRPDA